MEKTFETEVLTRLTVIETKLDEKLKLLIQYQHKMQKKYKQ